MAPEKETLEEKQILASFISKLPEAIIICDARGRILLHDRQAETYLLSRETSRNGPSPPLPDSMSAKPITSFMDKNLIEHSLDEINQKLKQGSSNPVSRFLFRKDSLVFQTQIVPVLTQTSRFNGFVVILGDITRQNQAEKRVDALLTMLSKNARSPMASIRAAVEAMKSFPEMDEKRQLQFIDIIYNESLVLSDILGSASEEYHRLIHTKKSLTSVPVHELLSTLARRAKDRLDIECHVSEASDREQVSIQADPFILIISLLLILDQLKHETGLMEFSGSFTVKNKIVFLDISWEGDPLSSTLIHLWEFMEIDTRNQSSPILLKDVLNQHQSALWLQAHQDPGAANTAGTPCVRFFMPLDETGGSFEQVTALPESRNLLMDMEMFDHSDQTLALDNRLLTELSYTTLIREINQASNLEQIIGKHSQLPRLIHSMLTGGTKVKTVTWLITAFSDAILNKLLEFALADLGPPPTAFAFITLGSEGRKEQTLKTDQDNAIIFKDPEPPESIETIQAYFLALGEKVCTWLDQSGYDFCQGGIMAKNPRWCQPLSVWKTYFSTWIHTPSPEDLLHTTIFFDLRFAYGDQQLTDALISYLSASLSGWPGFFRNMAENAVYFKPPIGLFGRLRLIKSGPFKHCLDIKMANIPIVDFARIYALKHGIQETCTQDRLYHLYLKRVLSREAYNEIEQAYGFLMQLRFMEQTHRILALKTKAENQVNAKHLSSIEKQMLKQILKKNKALQSQLEFEFIGGGDQQQMS